MAVLLITYDLNSPGQKHAKLLEKVKQYNWARSLRGRRHLLA